MCLIGCLINQWLESSFRLYHKFSYENLLFCQPMQYHSVKCKHINSSCSNILTFALFDLSQQTHWTKPKTGEWMHACVKDIAILVKNMSLGSSGEEKVSRSLSSCSSCLSICLRLFSRFSADTDTHTRISRHTHTHICNSTHKHTHVPRKCEERSRERTTQLQVQSYALLFWGSESIREKQHTKQITGKPAQLQSMLIMGSHCARNTMGIKNDWGKNKHQVAVRSIHSFLSFCLLLIYSCVCRKQWN